MEADDPFLTYVTLDKGLQSADQMGPGIGSRKMHSQRVHSELKQIIYVVVYQTLEKKNCTASDSESNFTTNP